MITYSVRFDGVEIDCIEVHPNECNTQYKRDIIRQGIADHKHIPRHYLKLHRVPEYLIDKQE